MGGGWSDLAQCETDRRRTGESQSDRRCLERSAKSDPHHLPRRAARPLVAQETNPPANPRLCKRHGQIDHHFVLASLEKNHLAPSPEADPRTLLRRLSFDLIGLPPTPEAIAAFVRDPDPTAYEKAVERLLSSRHYGERWARHWLDAVRYGDSHGFERDEFRPTMYRYRDYVIRSLNSDKPFDVFLREQLAGDEMQNGTPKTPAEADRLIATGYLRLGP